MPYRDETYDLRVEIATENYDLSPQMRAALEADIEGLRGVVKEFPVAELHVDIQHFQRKQDFRVKTNLRLPKRNVFAGDRDELLQPAFERCMRRLVSKVKAYKEKLSSKDAYSKEAQGTAHEVAPSTEPDAAKLTEAVVSGDYGVFRDAMSVYDESLSKRIGRWVERYPDLAARLGEGIVITDLIEEVYLVAFDRFAERPADRLGHWLENLIDESVRIFAEEPDREKENIRLAEEVEESRERPRP